MHTREPALYEDECICGNQVRLIVCDDPKFMEQEDHAWIRCANCGHINWASVKTHAEKVMDGRTYDRA